MAQRRLSVASASSGIATATGADRRSGGSVARNRLPRTSPGARSIRPRATTLPSTSTDSVTSATGVVPWLAISATIAMPRAPEVGSGDTVSDVTARLGSASPLRTS